MKSPKIAAAGLAIAIASTTFTPPAEASPIKASSPTPVQQVADCSWWEMLHPTLATVCLTQSLDNDHGSDAAEDTAEAFSGAAVSIVRGTFCGLLGDLARRVGLDWCGRR